MLRLLMVVTFTCVVSGEGSCKKLTACGSDCVPITHVHSHHHVSVTLDFGSTASDRTTVLCASS
jgi:hypothetical protein